MNEVSLVDQLVDVRVGSPVCLCLCSRQQAGSRTDKETDGAM